MAPLANLYVVSVYLSGGPTSEKFANKEISRVIEIRGDQTLEQLHNAIFQAYDRVDEHLYQFQLGKRPFDPNGPNFGTDASQEGNDGEGDARTTKLDDLDLKKRPCFRLLVRFWRQLVSPGSGGQDRTSHPDRDVPACHQTGRQISSAVLRRVTAASRIQHQETSHEKAET